MVGDMLGTLGVKYDPSGYDAGIKHGGVFVGRLGEVETAMARTDSQSVQLGDALKSTGRDADQGGDSLRELAADNAKANAELRDTEDAADGAGDGLEDVESKALGLGESLLGAGEFVGGLAERFTSLGGGAASDALGGIGDKVMSVGQNVDLAKGLVGGLGESLGGLAGGQGVLAGLSSGFGSLLAMINPVTLAIGAVAIGVIAVGAVVVDQVGKAVAASHDLIEAQNQAEAQFGSTAAEAEALGAVGVEAWKNNWGDSITDATVRAGTLQHVLGGVGSEALGQATQASFAFEQVFGKSVDEQNMAMQSLINNFDDLGGDGTKTLDLLTAGFQNGANSQDDLLDTSAEYSSFFSQMGFTSAEFFGILQQGMDAGAQNTDRVADAFKEFQIRVTDGSDTTRDALASLGLDEELGGQMARGEVAFDEGFNQMQTALLSMDADLREQAGVALFGTQWEDTMRGVIGDIDLATAGVVALDGATLAAGDAANRNLSSGWQTVQKSATAVLLPLVMPFVDAVKGPAIDAVFGLGQRLQDIGDSAVFEILAKGAAFAAEKVGDLLGGVVSAGGAVLDAGAAMLGPLEAGAEKALGFARFIGLVDDKTDALADTTEEAAAAQGQLGDAMSETESQLAAGKSAIEDYSGSLTTMLSGSGPIVGPGVELSEEGLEKMQDELDEIRSEQNSALQQMLADRQTFQSQHAALISQGKGEEAAELATAYEAESAAQSAHLAQMTFQQVQTMLRMGQISEDRAKLILGSLQSAFPDSDFLDGSAVAMIETNARIGTALTDTSEAGDEAAIGLGEAFLNMDETLDRSAEKAEEYEQAAVEHFQEVSAASEEHAEGVEESAERVATAELEASDEAASAHAARRGDLEETGEAAASQADDVEEAGRRNIAAEQEMAAESAKMQGVQREEFGKTGSVALGTAADVTKGWSAVPDTIAQSGAEAARSVEDLGGSVDGTARSIEEMQAIAAEGGSVQVEAMDDGAVAAEDAGSAMADTTEEASALGDAMGELPVDLEFDGDQPLDLLVDLNDRIDELRSNAERGFAVTGTYRPKGRPMEAGSPFVLSHMVDDLRENAADGFSVYGRMDSRTDSVLGATSSGSELTLQAMLRRMSESDYEVVVRTRFETGDLISDISSAVDEARTLFETFMGTHDAFFRAGESEDGSLASILAGGSGVGELGVPPQFEQMLSFLDSLPSMAHLLANPEDRAEIMEMIDEQSFLWERFIEDLEAAETARHEKRMEDIGIEAASGEQAADDALERIDRLLAIRRAGNTGANEDGEEINLEDFSGEIERVAQMMFDLGLIPEASKPALEAYYSSMTGGVNTAIERSDDLLDVIELMKEQWLAGTDDQMTAEDARHEAVMEDIEDQSDLIDRAMEDWERGIERVGDAEDALAERRKEFLSDLKAERKDAEKLEKSVTDGVLDRIDEMEDREKDAHEARMDRIDAREDREEDRHQSEIDRFEEAIAKEREQLDALEDGLTELERQKVDKELEAIGDGIALNLDEAESALDGLNKAISNFDKKSEIRERRRRRASVSSRDRGADKVGLDPDARAGLQAALDSGSLSAEGARRAEKVLGGANLGAEQMRQLLEEAGLQLNNTLDARRDEIDLLDTQIAKQQLLIDQETFRFDAAEEAIQGQIDAEDTKHEARMEAIGDERQAEKDAWDAFQERADDARDAARQRHEEKMAEIEREFRAQLIAQGFLEEAGRDPDEIAAEIAAIADKIFGPIRDFVRGGEEASAVEPGGLLPEEPIGGEAPVGPGIGGGDIPGPGGPGTDEPAPEDPEDPEDPVSGIRLGGIRPAPGLPPPFDPTLPPGGIELPPGDPGSDGTDPSDLFSGPGASFLEGRAAAESIAADAIASVASAEAMVVQNTTILNYIQNAENQVFDDGSDGAEFLASMFDLIGMMSP